MYVRRATWLGLFPAAVLLFLVGIAACGGDDDDNGGDTPTPTARGPIVFTSDAFENGGPIPSEHSCEGDNTSPPLAWSNVPPDTVTLALTMDDIDANRYVHWVMYNIPPTSTGLDAAVPADGELADGSLQGVNSSNGTGYTGPCPPGGEHEYRLRIYALDSSVDLEPGATLAEVEAAIEDHVLAFSQLAGVFSR